MDHMARNQYFKELQKEYLKATKTEKSKLLDEAEKRTQLCRKHIIVKLASDSDLGSPRPRKKRKQYYCNDVTLALTKLWKIFDYPCGQRLAPLLKTEVDRLIKFGEIKYSSEIIRKLKQISAASIDLKLRREKIILGLNRNRNPSNNPLLYQKIPVKLNSDWDKTIPGNCQIDFVFHCGKSVSGQFINSLSLVDIYSGWWEGLAILPRSQEQTHKALESINYLLPFKLKEIHPDNDILFINDLIYTWTRKKKISFSRSRPSKKNDNAYVEQKNWTHIRKIFGYQRYDTFEELNIINDLYTNQLRLYKNFFQPITKLIKKERLGSKIQRVYDTPATPYHRLLESSHITNTKKKHLTLIYNSLNPAKLKREINLVLTKLHKFNNTKKPKKLPKTPKRSPNSSVRKYFIHQPKKTPLSVR